MVEEKWREERKSEDQHKRSNVQYLDPFFCGLMPDALNVVNPVSPGLTLGLAPWLPWGGAPGGTQGSCNQTVMETVFSDYPLQAPPFNKVAFKLAPQFYINYFLHSFICK